MKLFAELEKPREIQMPNAFEMLTGTSNTVLFEKVARLLKKPLDKPIETFLDGEVRPIISTSLRKKHAIILQSASPPHINNSTMEVFTMIDAARRASAGEITVVWSYFPYSRQDRKDQPRVPISASMIANLLIYIGADRIVTVDMHSDQAQGYISQPWDNLHASHVLAPRIKQEIDLRKLVLVAPDIGAAKMVHAYGKLLGISNFGTIYKERDSRTNGASASLELTGRVDDSDVLLIDDIFGTGGTLFGAAQLVKSRGAKRVYAAVTHGLFLVHPEKGDPLTTLTNSPFDKIFVTDTVNLRPELRKHPKICIVSVAPLLAESIRRIHIGQELTDLFH